MGKISFYLLLLIYNLITTSVSFILIVFLKLKIVSSQILKQRLGMLPVGHYDCNCNYDCNYAGAYENTIWIHGASVGEVLSVESLIGEIIKTHPNYKILITSHTQTSKEIIEKRFKGLAKHHFLCLDSGFLVKKFIKLYKPKLVLWLEQDFLPIHLSVIKKHNIPLLLLNARMSDGSFKRWSKLSFIIKNILANFNEIFANSLLDKKKYEVLSSKTLKYLGNLKYTNLIADKSLELNNNQEFLKLQKAYAGFKVMVYLSTHEKEEELAIDIHKNLKGKLSNLKTIIIPRHVKRIPSLMMGLGNEKLSLYSNWQSLNMEDPDVLMVDSMGKTDMFMAIANLVYIGKSMYKKSSGGHNILEPLAFGVPAIFGQYMGNFKGLVSECLDAKACVMVSTEEELKNRISSILMDKELQELKQNTSYVFTYKKTILENTLKEIYKYLPTIPHSA
jgi:3-deoxy-D-manno-octulosonic-acid transferase